MFTTEDCQKIVQKALGNSQSFNLIDFKLTRGSNFGFLGETFILNIRVRYGNQIKPMNFFVKRIPKGNHLQEKLVRECQVFNKEIYVYKNLLENFKEYIKGQIYPQYIYSKMDEVLVLENLEGFVSESIYKYFTLEQCEATLGVLAKFHAASIIFEETKQLKIGNIASDYLFESLFNDDEGSQMYQYFQVSLAAIDTIIRVHFPHVAVELRSKISNFIRNVQQSMKASLTHRNVLIHGDVWSNNIMFKYNDTCTKTIADVRIVDFQLIRYMPPAFDVLLLLYFTISSDLRKVEFKHLIAFYYDKLTIALNESGQLNIDDILPWEDFIESIQSQLPTILAIAVLNLHYVKIPKIRMEQILKNPEYYRQIVYIDRNDLVLESMKNDPCYRKCISDIVSEIIQYVEEH